MIVNMLPNESTYVNMFLVSIQQSSVTSKPQEASICCPPLSAEALTESDADELAGLLKALADPVRLRLMSIIINAPSGEMCACDLPMAVDRSQPTVSHHLGLLAKAGLIERQQRGKWAWFRANPNRLTALAASLTQDCC